MYRAFFKRAVDLFLATFGMLLLFPLIVVAVALVFFTTGQNPFFLHQRPGYREKPFKLIKLRTMLNERSSDGEVIPTLSRITPVGRVLRATSIDELPQLLNVIKGELSLVGPRPLEMWYLPHYSAEQRRRHEVKPGITGLAQVSGRNAISWEQKFALDVEYVNRLSFGLDCKILLKTVCKVIGMSGVYSGNGAETMEPFAVRPEDD